jgi:predicted HTH transcriptional regulator
MQALNSKHKITNDEVEKLLHISDASATRYLSALEKEGKIKQVGRTGAGVAYTKV